jgi:RecG-like helicase
MAITLSNFERFMRTKILDDAYKDIKSFAWSKKLATTILKRRATYDVCSWLCQRHEKVMRRKFCQYRFQVYNEKQRKARAKIIFGKINAQRRHRAMRKWREVIENEI